ncbi:MAG: MFS transporter [Eubacteriaceae bacterium]|nr:MFS transporter [Eubacteriaceae bacterium]
MSELIEEKKGFDTKMPYIFMIATICQAIGNNIAGSYINFYATERMMISTTMTAAALSVARFGDLLLSLVSGVIVQKIQLKRGQYRSWLLYGPFMVSFGTTLLFINFPIPEFGKYVQIFIGYMFYGGAMSFMQVSSNSMIRKIAGADTDARMSITAKNIQGQNLSRFLTSLTVINVILFFEGRGMDGYTTTQLLCITIGILGYTQLYRSTGQYEQYDPNFKSSGAGSVKISTMVASTLKNPQLIFLMIGDTCRATVMTTLSGIAMYVFTYVAGRPAMMAQYLSISAILAVASSFLLAPIARKMGKRNSGRLTAVMCIISYSCLGLFTGTNPWIYIVFFSIASASITFISTVAATLYMDCGEYQLHETGVDNRTFTMSMFGVTTKLGFFFSSVIVSWLLNSGGYSAVERVIANPETFTRLIGFTAASFYVVYAIIMFFFYKISDEKAKEYAAENIEMLQKREAEQKANA